MNTMTTSNLPTAWGDAEQLDGPNLLDKADLVGKPFRITTVYFTVNASGVAYVYADAENVEGETFTFNDSSTGVRQQLVAHLEKIGRGHIIASGEEQELNLVIPQGLRVSEYEIPGQKGKKARTFYLTTSGKRASVEKSKTT
jgi:hypothetical protein